MSSRTESPEPFQYPIGSGRHDFSIAPGSRVSLPSASKPPSTGSISPALAVALKRAIGKLRHRHVEHDRPGSARHSDHQRIVADDARRPAPWRQVGHGVGPADTDHPCLGRLPAVGPAAHPVIGVAQRHASHAMLASERDGARPSRPAHSNCPAPCARPSAPARQND